VLNFFNPFIESGQIELEAGGSLRDGTRMWALGKIKHSEADIVKGDTVRAYLLAATGFDGSLRKITKMCDTRVVCANTLAVARGENTTEWGNKHTKNFQVRAEQIQKQIAEALATHKQSVEAYRVLANKKMSETAQSEYIVKVIAGELPQKEWSGQLQTKVSTVIELIDSQRGLEYVPAIRGTAWQAYNAVSEYITHHAARTNDTRVNNQWFDPSTQGMNQRALEMALAA
jgi:phage/plasmid-like protein (TIGR03299 family)